MTIDMQKYKTLYFQEADQFLRQMQQELDACRQLGNTQESIAALHRLSHSMKSRSLIMGYGQLAHVSKMLEDYFRKIQESNKQAPVDLADRIDPIVQRIQLSLSDIKVNKPEHHMTDIISSFAS